MKKYNNVANWAFGSGFLIGGGAALAGLVWGIVSNQGLDISPVLPNGPEAFVWILMVVMTVVEVIAGVALLWKRHERPTFRSK